MIELTGPPCAGKSYALPYLLDLYQAQLCDQAWIDTQLGITGRPWLLRGLLREIWLLRAGAGSLGWTRTKMLIKAVRSSGWGLKRKVNVIRNVLAKYALHKLAARVPDMVLILDEGITHLPYIFATSNSPYPDELVTFFPNHMPSVIRFWASPEILKTRIAERGHAMLSIDWDIDRFVTANCDAEKKQDRILSKLPGIRVLTPPEIV